MRVQLAGACGWLGVGVVAGLALLAVWRKSGWPGRNVFGFVTSNKRRKIVTRAGHVCVRGLRAKKHISELLGKGNRDILEIFGGLRPIPKGTFERSGLLVIDDAPESCPSIQIIPK